LSPALRKQWQENLKFKVRLGYIARPCLKEKKEYIFVHREDYTMTL
jgi:hypothetical protein